MTKQKENVLVAILKTKRDLRILRREHWYRIPVRHAPKRPFTHLAFYQPTCFGRNGKQIEYYAQAMKRALLLRRNLLPSEARHPRARDTYYKIGLKDIRKLPQPIKNNLPRRISFGFTTLARLKTARNILELYAVTNTEEILASALRRAGIAAIPQKWVIEKNPSRSLWARRYRLDFAIPCRKGSIAVECDNLKAHGSKTQRAKDRAKDGSLKKNGWTVIRLREPDITKNPNACALQIKKAIQKLGGQK